jgi:hypothetical protein
MSMSTQPASLWPAVAYTLHATADPAISRLDELAPIIYERVCRTRFDSPGFYLINLGPEASSRSLRQVMVSLKEGLGGIHQARAGQDLVFVSAGRFDQQVTTKLHRDGGPDECFLMLGYEPSAIVSDIAIGDYAKCAFDLGLSASEFLDRHNPMFVAGEELLRPYTTPVESFSNQSFQILLVNNSIAPYSSEEQVWQGVLHTATIRNPSSSARRVVNSTMIASVPLGTEELLSDDQRLEFLNTTVVRRRGYDQPELDDDP